jgi:glycosyltransferase involved in cell wall biosynthesis
MKKKVAIVGTAGLPAAYGGFETLAQNLVTNLGDDYEITVYCRRTPCHQRQARFGSARLIYLPLDSNGWQAIPYDIVSLFHAFATADVVVYLGPSIGSFLPVNRIFRKLLVVNFGGLNEWERGKYSSPVQRYVFWSHRMAARSATVNVVDNFVLQRSLYATFGRPSVVIRYGGDHASVPEDDPALRAKYPFAGEPYFVSVARAQVDNNLHVVIDAFRGLPDRKLVLVSNWSVSEYGRNLFRENQDIPNVRLLTAIYDAREINYVRSRASAYIHTHSYCGTAPSLVEAICLGLPIISWDVPTNRETTQGHALFFDSAASLQELVRTVTPGQLVAIKDALAPLAKEEFQWSHISQQYADIFEGRNSRSG